MKIKFFNTIVLLTIIFFVDGLSQQSKLYLKVKNSASFDRKTETIVLRWDTLKKKSRWLDSTKVIVFDSKCKSELVTQTLGDEFLFQSDFKPHETKTFVLYNSASPKPSPESIVDVKFVIPREDVAWENDRIAYRIYGSKLAGDVRNGIDVWVKRVRYHIIDNWYHGDSLKGSKRISYHVDHGEGADMFNVGKSLGAGGCAIWKDSILHQTGLFTSHKIIATGPIRTLFTVWYGRDSINGQPFTEEKTYTLDAGENLNRIHVRYYGVQENGQVSIAAGLVKRKNTFRSENQKQGWLSLWGLADDDSTNGFIGTGVVFPPTSFPQMKEDKDHYLIIGSTSADKQFTYYAGACWTRSGDFNNVKDWNNYLNKFSLRQQTPLHITISNKK
jgi:pectinesterase